MIYSSLIKFVIALAIAPLAFATDNPTQQQNWFIQPSQPAPEQSRRPIDMGIFGATSLKYEANAIYGSRNSAMTLGNTDGPTLVLDIQLAKGIKFHMVTGYERQCQLSNSHFSCAWDAQSWVKEATIMLDCPDKKSGCYATAIGKQIIPTGMYESQMPIDNIAVMKGLSQEKGVYGFRIQIDPLFANALDEIAVSVFQQIRDTKVIEPGIDDGDTYTRNGTGGGVYMTKQFTDRLKVGGGFTAVAFRNNPGIQGYTKVQANIGAVYKFSDEFRVFTEGVGFSNYFPYPNAHYAFSIGAIHKLGPGDLNVEYTRIGGTMHQFGIAYIWDITKEIQLGPEALYNICARGLGGQESTDVCSNGISALMQIQFHGEYQYIPQGPKGHVCYVGDVIPGCSIPGTRL